jgi:hypothetical protein
MDCDGLSGNRTAHVRNWRVVWPWGGQAAMVALDRSLSFLAGIMLAGLAAGMLL